MVLYLDYNVVFIDEQHKYNCVYNICVYNIIYCN